MDINNLSINPMIIFIIIIVIIGYFALFSSLGDTGTVSVSTENNGKIMNIIGFIFIIILIALIISSILKYFYNINIYTYFTEIFSDKPKIDIIIDKSTYEPSPVPTIRWKKQVFNIPGNYYNYDNAKALCKAYGAELATYKQIEEAYNEGAEWCNYGWSSDQMVLFPTQQKTFDKLQEIPGHEHDCGRPGINGGYIANPNAQFGVNCFGNKPRIREEERMLMKNTTPFQETKEDLLFDKKVDVMRNNIDEILVSPFNYKSWSQL